MLYCRPGRRGLWPPPKSSPLRGGLPSVANIPALIMNRRKRGAGIIPLLDVRIAMTETPTERDCFKPPGVFVIARPVIMITINNGQIVAGRNNLYCYKVANLWKVGKVCNLAYYPAHLPQYPHRPQYNFQITHTAEAADTGIDDRTVF